jgi:maleylacetate reductase
MHFVHEPLPQRVCFEPGQVAAALRREVGELGAERVMVISSARQAELTREITAGLPVALRYDDVAMHVPIETAERARAAAEKAGADALVCIGGGSTTGLAKAIALTGGLPIIAVPTTYAGIRGHGRVGADGGRAQDHRHRPQGAATVIVYDAALTTSLPVEMSVASGFNALAHCVDSMWAPKADPINAAFAAEGIRMLTEGLPQGGRRADGPARARARTRRRVPVGGGVRLGGLRAAPQDLPRPRRRLQPAARPDAHGRAALRPGLQRTRGPRRRTPHRHRLRLPTALEGLQDLRHALNAPRRCATTASRRATSRRRPR